MTAGVSQLRLNSPLSGWAMPLDEVPDPVFAGRMLGDGLAIDPTEGHLHAPCDGVLVSVAPTRHAVTLRADNGAEILVHIGIDTVGLKGEGFESYVEAGRRVRAGDRLLGFDLDLVARRAPSLITPLVVTNGAAFEIVRRQLDQSIAQGEFLMELHALEAVRAVEPQPTGAAIVRRLRVPLPHGIHARPAALIAQKVREFDAAVTVIAHGRRASAASAVSLMSLGVHRDDEITLEAVGGGAHAVLDALGELIGGTHAGFQPPLENRLRAEFSAAAPPAPVRGAGAGSAAGAPVRGAELPGVVASRGTAIGPATFVARPERTVVEEGAGVARETAELTRARDAVRATLTGLAARESGPRAEIVAAHLEFLDDPALAAAAARLDRSRQERRLGLAQRDPREHRNPARARRRAPSRASRRPAGPGIAGAGRARGGGRCPVRRTPGARDRARGRAPAVAARRTRCKPAGGNLHGARRSHLACRHSRGGDGQADAGECRGIRPRGCTRHAPPARRRARRAAG